MTRSPQEVPRSRRAGPLLALAAALLAAPAPAADLSRGPAATPCSFNVTMSPRAGAIERSAPDQDPALASGDAATFGRPQPNPFRDTMRFAYTVPGDSAHVDIAVFDESGRRVRILSHGTQASGKHEAAWDGSDPEGRPVPDGVYFLRARVGEARRISRITYRHE
jgi:hypothetical protein